MWAVSCNTKKASYKKNGSRIVWPTLTDGSAYSFRPTQTDGLAHFAENASLLNSASVDSAHASSRILSGEKNHDCAQKHTHKLI